MISSKAMSAISSGSASLAFSEPSPSRCHQPAPGYDQLPERRFEFIPLWGFFVFLLYALLFVIPLLGWLMSSARNFPVSWFGLITLPDFIEPNRPAYEFLHDAHEFCAKLLAAVASIHIAAALKHHFINRDDVLKRMLPLKTGWRL